MNKIIYLLVPLAGFSCRSQESDNSLERVLIQPFEVKIIDADYSLGGSNEYNITEKDVKVIRRSGLVGVKVSLVYSKSIPLTEEVRRMSKIDLDTLKGEYLNSLVQDGTQIQVILKKKYKEKTIRISNFYHPNIGELIDLVNSQVPDNFKISYKKEFMVHPDHR